MRPFIVDESLRLEISRVVAYAEKHVYKYEYTVEGINRRNPVPGDMVEHTILTRFGYKIVFSMNESAGTTYRYLSMSVDVVGKFPNPYVVEEVMELFGYRKKLEDCIVREEILPLGRKAIRVLEPV